MILVTGAAGFIGYHTCKTLLNMDQEVVGLDSINDYYDQKLKWDRVANLKRYPNFAFYERDISHSIGFSNIKRADMICHLAAYAGIPYSIKFPELYEYSNSYGTFKMLELAREWKVKNFVYASSSSVYGESDEISYEDVDVNKPLNMYAATKRYNELQARVYSSTYGVPCTGLRFFTVYGTWGRPDMAIYIWTDALYNGTTLKMNGFGKMERNFTYVTDVVKVIIQSLFIPEQYEIYNIANTRSVVINDVVCKLEELTGIVGRKDYVPVPPGEIMKSRANVDKIVEKFHYKPSVDIEEGLEKFVTWYKNYYGKE